MHFKVAQVLVAGTSTCRTENEYEPGNSKMGLPKHHFHHSREACLPYSQFIPSSLLFRIINVIGDPIDERGPINTDKKQPIHAEAPEFVEMSVEQEILVTGIKV